MFFLSVFILIAMARRKLEAAQAAIATDADIPDGYQLPSINSDLYDGGAGLRKFILSQYKRGKITARDVCGIAFWSTRAGASGVSDLSKDPRLDQGGAFTQKVLSAINARSKSSFYTCKVPLWCHQTQSRTTTLDFPFHLPHEIFAELYTSTPDIFEVLELEDLPPTWAEHDVHLEHQGKAVPVSFYSDGVPHTKNDSFIAYYFQVLNSPVRHLITTVRKNDCCKCGCRGECTTGLIQRVIAWSYNVLATGLFPHSDFMGRPFVDETRFNMRGFELAGGYVGGLIEYTADILEFVGALGFKRWSDNVNPCFICGCPKHALFDFPKTFDAYAWTDRDPGAYQTMCMRSIQKILVSTKADLRHLMGHMEFNFDMWGYALDRDCPKFNLKKGQRLIVVGPIEDMHDLKNVALPAELSFFDNQSGMGINFVSALLTGVRGFNISHIALDCMHILDLGVSQHLCGMIMRKLVVANFAKSTKRLARSRQVDNMIHLRRYGWGNLCFLGLLAGAHAGFLPPFVVKPHMIILSCVLCAPTNNRKNT